jgi:hypothetical protein
MNIEHLTVATSDSPFLALLYSPIDWPSVFTPAAGVRMDIFYSGNASKYLHWRPVLRLQRSRLLPVNAAPLRPISNANILKVPFPVPQPLTNLGRSRATEL